MDAHIQAKKELAVSLVAVDRVIRPVGENITVCSLSQVVVLPVVSSLGKCEATISIEILMVHVEVRNFVL